MCPMRFNKFPLDEHSCKFLVGSTNYDDKRMILDEIVKKHGSTAVFNEKLKNKWTDVCVGIN